MIMDKECNSGLIACRKTLYGDSLEIFADIYAEKKNFIALCKSDCFNDLPSISRFNPITCSTNDPLTDFCQIPDFLLPTGDPTCEFARRMELAMWLSVILSSILLVGWTILIVKIA